MSRCAMCPAQLTSAPGQSENSDSNLIPGKNMRTTRTGLQQSGKLGLQHVGESPASGRSSHTFQDDMSVWNTQQVVPFAYFYQGGGWNQNSRFDLVRSLI